MKAADWIKQGGVFVAAIFTVWLSGVVPVLILQPAPYAGQTPMQVFAQMGAVDKLVDQHEQAGIKLGPVGAAGRERDQIGDAGPLHHVDIGAVVDIGG